MKKKKARKSAAKPHKVINEPGDRSHKPFRLYKYVASERISVLQDGLIRFTQPGGFNDPFEMRPIMSATGQILSKEELRSGLSERMRKEFSGMLSSQQIDLLMQHFVKSREREIASVLSDAANVFTGVLTYKAIPDGTNSTLGILSLTENPNNLLMWAHYAASHSGFVVELNPQHQFFSQRISDTDEIRHVRKVVYTKSRPVVDIGDENSSFNSLLCKPEVWSYEQEWRMMLPLKMSSKSVKASPHDIHLFSLPFDAITGVVLGHRISAEAANEIVETIAKKPELRHVSLMGAHMHPREFSLDIKPFTSHSDLDTDAQNIELAKSGLFALYGRMDAMASVGPDERARVLTDLQKLK